MKPGIWGGANWPPSSYDPRAQHLFVCASSVLNGFTGGGDASFAPPVEGGRYAGGQPMTPRMPRTGIIAAMDMTTNTVVWRYRWPEQCYSGTLATGGNLLFVGRNDGRLTALDSRTGKQLWEFQTGAGMHAPDEHLRAPRQAVRACVFGRQRADRLGARRQRLAVRPRRHAAARRARHAGVAARRGAPLSEAAGRDIAAYVAERFGRDGEAC